ncbi:unnamed protein product [Amoebophrya sp. A120]|nr:unnamed protein product [Amoebophrya sp. A120]|eukprot:GSA120T00016296001.1
MQVHTLVSAFANGIRLNLGFPPVESDVLSHLPYLFFSSQEVLSPDAGMQTLALPILSLLWFPVITTSFGYEKRFGLLEMMRIQSLSTTIYWLTNYVWFFILYFSIIGSYLALFYAVASDNYDIGQLFFIHFLWGHCQIGLSLLCAAAFYKSESLTAVTYFWMSIAYLSAGPLLEAATIDGGPMPWALIVWGPTNYGRSLVLALKYKETDSSKSMDLWEKFTASEEQEYGELLLVQFLVGSLVLLVAILWLQGVHVVVFEKIRRFVMENIVDRLAANDSFEEDDSNVLYSDAAADPSTSKARVDAIQLRNIYKQYPDGKKAVNGVSFGVKKGECFGLLGPNGAGKTSCINLVCGLQKLSKGSIVVSGTSGDASLSQLSQYLGVCPQFDCVWNDLTVEEHLALYARIKGISGYKQKVLVRNVAESVALEGDAFRKLASELSGGMRRRLSLAISLVTNPAVLILDEPTTGLDPDTRAGLWQVIANESKKRAVVLTTHSMEEADALCERIGIMCSGKLKCVGTPLHLKNKFGNVSYLKTSSSPPHYSCHADLHLQKNL